MRDAQLPWQLRTASIWPGFLSSYIFLAQYPNPNQVVFVHHPSYFAKVLKEREILVLRISAGQWLSGMEEDGTCVGNEHGSTLL